MPADSPNAERSHPASTELAQTWEEFHLAQWAEFDANLRTLANVAMGTLTMLAVPLLMLVPAVATTMGLTFRSAAPVVAPVPVVVLLTTLAYKKYGFQAKLYQFFDHFESFAVQACIGVLLALSGKADSAMWFFYILHALVVSLHPAQRPGHLVIVLAMPLVLSSWFTWQHGFGTATVVPFIAVVMAALTFSVGFGLQRRFAKLEFQRNQLQMDLSKLQVEKERNRIARDLHDGMTADLTAIAWKAEALANQIHKDAPSDDLFAISKRARAAIDDTRSVIWALRREAIRWNELGKHIRGRCVELCGDRATVEFGLSSSTELAKGELAVDIIRVVQESVRNALEHGSATQIRVSLIVDERVQVIVDDNGSGMAQEVPRSKTGGLQNLRARAQKHGGQLDIQDLDPGVRISVVMPK